MDMLQMEWDLLGEKIHYDEGYAFFNGCQHLSRRFQENEPDRHGSGGGLHDCLDMVDVFPPSFNKRVKVLGKVYIPIRCKVRRCPPNRFRSYESAAIDQILDPHPYLDERMKEVSVLDDASCVDPGYLCNPCSDTNYIVSNGYDVISGYDYPYPDRNRVCLYTKVRNEKDLLMWGHRFHEFPATELIPRSGIVLRVQNNCVVDLFRWNYYRQLIVYNVTGKYVGGHEGKMANFRIWTDNECIRPFRGPFVKMQNINH